MRQHNWLMAAGLIVPMAGLALLAGCGGSSSSSGGGGGTTGNQPQIQNINSSTTATSPVNLPVDISGSGFQSAPGKVTFTQGSLSVDVTPTASAWSSTGIQAVVPAGNGTTNFTVPGTLNVTVTTSAGTSNSEPVNLVPTLSFRPSAMTWAKTTQLPAAMTGMAGVAVRGNSSSNAFVVLTGGYNGTANTNTVWADNWNQNGTVGSATNKTWLIVGTRPLPTTLAFQAMAEADDTNSPVPAGTRDVYVIGGQVSAGSLSGSATVYLGTVNPSTGFVNGWTSLNSRLPQALYGMSASVYNGYLYVVGGMNSNDDPVNTVYTAPINSDGTLGVFTPAKNFLPKGEAFGSMFLYGDTIYYIDGDPDSSIPPGNQDIGDYQVYFASAVRGVVGPWTQNANLTIYDRAKGVLFTAFGQVIQGEGVYFGSVGSGEMETSAVNLNNTTNAALGLWSSLAASSGQVPQANVYNAVGVTSPLISATGAPRFLLLGGQYLTGVAGPGGTLSVFVYYNNAP